MMLWIGVERSYINQLAVGSVPNGVMYGNQIAWAGYVDNVPMMEHPTEFYSAAILLNLTHDVLEAFHRLLPLLRAVAGKSERLKADCGGECLNMSTQIWFGKRAIPSSEFFSF